MKTIYIFVINITMTHTNWDWGVKKVFIIIRSLLIMTYVVNFNGLCSTVVWDVYQVSCLSNVTYVSILDLLFAIFKSSPLIPI